MGARIFGTAPRPPLTPPKARAEAVERERAAVEALRPRSWWVLVLAIFNLAVAVLAFALAYLEAM